MRASQPGFEPMRLALLFFLLLFCHPAGAQPAGGFQTNAAEAILIDYDTGATLYEKNADKPFAPASLTKIMTLKLLFKKLKSGEISLESSFPVSLHAWKDGGAPSRTTSMFVPLNATATVEEFIQGIVVQNANDGAIAVAESLAGSEDGFAQAMTEEARALGLEKSTFGNASGLPNPANQMTARELARLSMHIIKEYPDYYSKYFAQKEFKFRVHTFKNMNPLINAPLAVDGLKFGFTEGVGHGIAASATKDGRRLVVVMNGLSDKEKRDEPLKMLNWGFANFKAYKVFNKDDVIGEARVWGGQKWSVPVKAEGDVMILLPLNAKDQRIKAQIVYQGPLKPPVKQGDRVGEVRITSESNGVSNAAPIFAAADMEPGGLVSKGIDSVLLGVNSYVSQAVTKLLKKPPQPAAAAAPALSKPAS
jgi:serine-type D-Ala-D-Ala carboxypeptidase (penicillin-binding protein 5/6)